MGLLKDLGDLVQAGVIPTETADAIRAYYDDRRRQSPNRVILLFSIIGSLLTGLGILFILAHNWDQFSRLTKSVLAFVPLLLCQALCAYTLLRKSDHSAWRESASSLLVFAVGGCMSLIAQIFHLSGSLSDFLLTWCLLSIPLVYIMRSSVTSLLVLAGASLYVLQSLNTPENRDNWMGYLLLLAGLAPHYRSLLLSNKDQPLVSQHHWGVSLSLILFLVSLGNQYDAFLSPAFFGLFASYSLIGGLQPFKKHSYFARAFPVLGYAGTAFLLFELSFEGFWDKLPEKNLWQTSALISPESLAAFASIAIAVWLLYKRLLVESPRNLHPVKYLFVPFVWCFGLGMFFNISSTAVSFLMIGLGIYEIASGLRNNKLAGVNGGLVLLAFAIGARLLDYDLSFIAKGILFVLLGIGFFLVNYRILKNSQRHEF
ncbi:MAG: DUF2157 domain-containing protein [Saprospiraceae bacterium]|jgi:uncharacterized membrane protein|nr:DUF2157 domain-containing protein [Saprospiraceae bacterium]MBP9209138.1 DUF2157 domain-containing protein [Saprospiraceae bacterium]MBV6473631.1 hypothetical protein [Saprospiraceae bacterium]